MKKRNTILGSLIALGLTAHLWALPQDPTPVNGQVQIQNGSNFVQILQQTPQAIINWGQFNIGLGETVRFLQPSQQAAILNRVTGLDPSVIQGVLQANGRVFLLNPNGILFGPNSVVDVGSFTASTLKMSNEDFLNGTYKLTQDRSMPLAALTNQGTIKVAEGGFVVLVSPLLDNQGMILAQAGQVQLGAGTQATFSVDGRGLVQFAMPSGFDPQFQGGGQGGTVLLQPGQMSQLLSQVVTNPALVEAGSFQPGANGQVLAHGAEGILLNSGTINTDGANQGGTIRLDSSQATILPASGVLSANSLNGNAGEVRLLSAGQTVSSGSISAATSGAGQGGFVEVSGKNLWLLGTINVASAQGTGGTILIDPTDITIVDGAGGTFDGQLPNPSGAGAGSVSVTGMQGFAAVTLNASHDVTYNGVGFTLPSTSLSVIAGNDILLTTSGTIQATTLSLQATRDVIITGTNNIGVRSSSGDLTISAGRDVSLSSSADLNLFSPTLLSFSAVRDLSLSTPQGFTMRLDAPRTNLSAGGNQNLTSSNLSPSSGTGNLTVNAGNVTWSSPAGGSFFQNSGNITVNATNNFTGNASNGNWDLRTSLNGSNITAGQSLAVNAAGATIMQANVGGGIRLTAPSLDLRGGNGVSIDAFNGLDLTASSGDVAVHGNANAVQLNGGNGDLRISAGQDVLIDTNNDLNLRSATAALVSAGRDISLSIPQGLTMRLDPPTTTLNAARNMNLRTSSASPSSGTGNLTVNAANVSWTDPVGGGSFALRAGNVTVNATNNFVGNASNGNWDVRSAVNGINVTAGQSFAANASGTVILEADNSGGVKVTAPTVSLSGGNGVSVVGVGNISLNATAGDVAVHGVANAVRLDSGGRVTVNATQDVVIDTNNDLNLRSVTDTLISAGRDLSLFTPQGLTMRFDSPVTTLNAVRNSTIRTSSASPSSGTGNLTVNAANVTWSDPGGGSFFLSSGNVAVNATNDFTGNATNGNWDVRGGANGLNFTAGHNLTVNAAGTVNFQADNGGVNLTGQGLDLRGGNGVTASGSDAVSLAANNGDLIIHGNANQVRLASSTKGLTVSASGDVLLDTNNDLNLISATTTLISAGRDLTVFTPQGLTMRFNSPVTNLNATRNLTVQTSSASPSGGSGNLTVNAANVTWRDPGNGSFFLGAGNIAVNATNNFTGNGTNGDWDVRTGVSGMNITAGQNFAVSAAGATRMLAQNGGGVSVAAQAIDLRGGNGVFVTGVDNVGLTASNGDIGVHGNVNQVQLASTTKGVTVSASGDVALDTNNDLNLSSATSTVISAGRDLSVFTPQGLTMRFDSPVTTLSSARNLSVKTSNANVPSGGGNLTMNAGNVTWSDPNNGSFFLTAGNIVVNATNNFTGNGTNGNWDVRSSVSGINVTAGQNFAVNAAGSILGLANNGGGVGFSGQNLDLRGGNGVFINGVDAVNLSASNGDVVVRGNANQVQLTSTTKGLSVSASGDVLLDTNNDLNVSSATSTLVSAGRDLRLATPQGLTMRLTSPETDLVAGRNLTLVSSNANSGGSGGLLSLNAGNISLLDPGNGSFSLQAGSFAANASQNFVGNATGGGFNLSSGAGLNVTAGGNFLVNASAGKSISAGSDRLNIGAGNVSLSGVDLTANNNASLGLTSAGNLSVGPLHISSGGNASLSGANIIIDSMQNVTGGNYTINTPGNLTEITAATNPSNLTGLNISAGRVFNTGSGNGKFSIPNVSTPGALAALVTAGNDSVFQSSASFQTFNGASLNPGHIDHQTGDIYVNGVLVYGGLPAILPPDPPPSPPPTPNPPPEPIVVPAVTPQVAQQQQSQLTPEQRSQILSQSNLALGNLGSFSRELSETERAQLSARMDSLHQTWPLDPFSPTLALTVPGGRPPVYASELAQLQALLLMSTPSDDPLDKDRGAYNVIVDQELREIWEVRYWRHLLEGFIIWEDRE